MLARVSISIGLLFLVGFIVTNHRGLEPSQMDMISKHRARNDYKISRY